MALKKEPNLPDEFEPSYGYREDFNGIGVFLFRS